MAEVKITALPAYADPASTDVLPIVDVVADLTKKVSIDSLLKNAPTGSASAPSFAFDLDGNTGMYRSGADALAFSTGGTGRLFITDNGNVGINTSTPQRELHILKAGGDCDLRIESTGAGNDARVDLIANSTGVSQIRLGDEDVANAGAITYDHSSNSLDLRTNGVARATIDSSGNVGIGATSITNLSGYAQLVLNDSNGGFIDITDDGNIQARIIGSGNLLKLRAAGTGGELTLETSGSNERMRIDSSGNVGIGTSSPNANLELGPVSATQGPTLRLSAGAGGGSGIPEYPFGTLEFYSNDTSVAAAVKASIAAVANTASTAPGGELTFSTHPYGAVGSLTERMRIDSSGNVGVGTSPTYKLDVQGGRGRVTANSETYSIGVRYSNANDPNGNYWIGATDAISPDMVFSNNAGNERMRITDDGKVGIGTSSPDTTLRVTTSAVNEAAQANDIAVFERNDNGYIKIYNANNKIGGLAFGDPEDAFVGAVRYDHSVNAMDFFVNNEERLRIDSSGKVGIGETDPQAKLHVKQGQSGVTPNANRDTLFLEAPNNAGLTIGTPNANTAFVAFGDPEDENAGQIVYRHSNNSMSLYTNGSESLRIDSGGRLLVGTSTATGDQTSGELVLQGSSQGELYLSRGSTPANSGSGLGYVVFTGDNGEDAARILAFSDGGTWTDGSSHPTRLVFSTTADGDSSPTERMRITSGGQIIGVTETNHILASKRASNGTDSLAVFRHSATSTTSSGTNAFIIRTNGDAENINDSYGAISDIKLKENIVDAKSQWDDFKAVRFRKYNFKEETGHETFTQLGVIAQELELVSPGLVTETPDLDEDGNALGTTTKSVKYSILTKKALVALQEAMERIEQLEAKVAALEAQ